EAADHHEVVGIVADARYDLRQPAAPTIYFPLRTSGTIHVRVPGDPSRLAARLRQEISAGDPLFRVSSIGLESTVVDQTLLREGLSIALPLAALFTAAALSAILPAVRAARVDPVIALRYE